MNAYESEFSRLSDTDVMSEGMICSIADSLATIHVESLLSCITHDLQSEEEVGFQVAKVQAFPQSTLSQYLHPAKAHLYCQLEKVARHLKLVQGN